jgi:glycosyltransferase involved in cell wall biosynthesis
MIFHIVWHGWVQRNRPLRQIICKKPQALVYRHMERKICRETDAIISISPNVRNDILLIDDVESKTVDIPNGVNVERFSPIPGVTDNKFTVYFQGRLVEMKNPGLLTEAAALSEEDWELVIGGDGPLRDDLEQFVRERDVQDRVDFLGYVPDSDLPERYASADIFALPSDYEGMPLTVLEAAASGTAVLASPRAATDFVTDKMGIVLEPDPTSIAATLDKLARNPDRTVRMGEVARKRAESYSWAAVAERYESLYNDLLSRKN